MQPDDHSVFDHLLEGVQVIDAEWQYVYVNASLCKQVRATKEELMGRLIFEKYPGIEKTEMFSHLDRCMRERQADKMVNRFQFLDGTFSDFELRMQPMDPEGLLVFSIELSEQKKAEAALFEKEERYKLIFDGIEEGFIVHEIVTDATGVIIDVRFVDVNGAGEKILGRSKSEIVGHLRSEFLGALDNQLLNAFSRAAFNKESVKVERYLPALDKWFQSLVYSPKEGQIITLNRDITEQIKWEKQLTRLNQELETKVRERTEILHAALQRANELSHLKSDFVSMASHEFRTPLSTLLTSVSLLEKYIQSGEKERCSKHIKRAKESIKGLTNIMDDFLSLDKLEQGKVRVFAEEVVIEEFVSEIIDDFAGICKERQRINYQHNGNHTSVLDKNIFRNVLLNLVSNALKYSEHDVEVITESDGKRLSLTVIDRGIGIPQEELEKLFNKYFRATNTQNIQGTGLGLNLVKQYLDLIQGTISLSSKMDVGTTFYVTIPEALVFEYKESGRLPEM